MTVIGDARRLPFSDGVAQCVVTSPPYYGLRDYGTATWIGGSPECDHKKTVARHDGGRVNIGKFHGSASNNSDKGAINYFGTCAKCGAVRTDKQIGLEQTPAAYVAELVATFREVRRVLRDDGVLWLNLGDSYSQAGKWGGSAGYDNKQSTNAGSIRRTARMASDIGAKEKDLLGIPWRVAFALQEPYVVPTCVKSEIDRAWLAAIFDGEGCIGIRRFNSYRKEKQQVYQDGFVVYTVVANNDQPILDRCIEVTGFGKVALKTAAGTTDERAIVSRRDSFGWRLDGNKAVDVVRAIYPYLIAKRKQACIAYTLDQLNKHGHGSKSVPPEVQEKKAYLKELINRCNQREGADLPSWIEEPKQEVYPGWYLRSDCIWNKLNPMPESVTDRPTKAHEYVFLLSKSARYFYDAEAVAEPALYPEGSREDAPRGSFDGKHGNGAFRAIRNTRNARTVWTFATQPYSGAHFATMPPKLAELCILAGSRRGDIVLDPFSGSGTTERVSISLGRRFIGTELNARYVHELRSERTAAVQVRGL